MEQCLDGKNSAFFFPVKSDNLFNILSNLKKTKIMSQTPTPHNSAKFGDIAETVIMAGDPLRVKLMAEKFLENPVQFNNVRNMLGYTGTYNGKRVSVMGHGMGVPSIAIYTYELYNFYGVKNIIRVGSAGSLDMDLNIGDLVIAMGACTNSNYADQYELQGTFAPIADYNLLRDVVDKCDEYGFKYKVGNVFTSDTFYTENARNDKWINMGVLAVEMEIAALYMNAARSGNKALGICTISDSIVKHEAASAEVRQNAFTNMMKVAFDII
jgi:purine-nucleoside phosphorylase